MKSAAVWSLIVGALLLGGCAPQYLYDYEAQPPALEVQSTARIAVGVLDQRPEVLSGAETDRWIGIMRTGSGNAAKVETLSGEPLSFDMTDGIVKALAARGMPAQGVRLNPGEDSQPALQALRATGAEKLLLINLRQWTSDAYTGAQLLYDVKAEVYDRNGEFMARHELRGKDLLGGRLLDPFGETERLAKASFGRVFGRLLNETVIKQAMQ